MRLIGEILIEKYGLSIDALDQCLDIQREKGGRIGEILIKQKWISEVSLLKALADQYGMEFKASLPVNGFDTGFTDNISIQFLKKYVMVPVLTKGNSLIAINNPLMFQPMDDLKSILELTDVKVVLAPGNAILSAINSIYDLGRDSVEQVIKDMHDDDSDKIMSEIQEAGDLLDDTSDAPIIKLVNHMLSQAVKERASDIHIESSKNSLKIRYRVDGILYDILAPPKNIQSALISRVKIMANMNIAEKRLPQDGRIEIKIGDKNIDIRASTIPTSFGERIVLRLLDKTKILLNVSDLGMSRGMLEQFNSFIRSPHGIILVTGPTGSGKTTTLYAALSMINNTDINIITIEDPVEYQINGIGQIQVNPKIDLTFAKGLRSIVRQDPDVILVGEIRDLETAEIAIQSALTGHLVFSTLHTNDSASAVTRLIDMGIEHFLVTSSVLAILAQRLVRTVCPECREEYIPSRESLVKINISPDTVQGLKLFRGTGCPACLNTGYVGRSGIFELMMLDETIQKIILKTSDSNTIKTIAIERGMQTLQQDGARLVLEGKTTIEEVFRVTH